MILHDLWGDTMNVERTLIDKQVVVIKDDKGSLPLNHHSDVYTSRDHEGNNVEWFKDAYGEFQLVSIFLRDGYIKYL
ncbi:hypothetical protein ACNQFZ_08760 [Schinkia sp. CFF1]